jgi:hypothetical protein
VWDFQWGNGLSPSPVLRFQNHSPRVKNECGFTRPECVAVASNQYYASELWTSHFGRDGWDDAGGMMTVNYDVVFSNTIRMHALAVPRFAYSGMVWSPSVAQPDTSDMAPVVVRTHHSTTGAEWSVGLLSQLVHDGNRYLVWRQSQGGQ